MNKPRAFKTCLSLLLVLALTEFALLAADPVVERRSLLNGLQIFAIPWGGSNRVEMKLLVKVGSAFDPVGKFGLVDILAELLSTGTETRPSEVLKRELAVLGVELDWNVTPDSTTFHLSGPPQQTRYMLEVLGQVVRRPSWSDADFQRLRSARAARLRDQAEQAVHRAESSFLKAVYGATSYGHLPLGPSAEELEKVTLVDLRSFFKRYFVPNNAFLVLSGPLQMKQVLAGISPHFGPWTMGEAVTQSFRPPEAVANSRSVEAGKGPSLVVLGGPGTSRVSEDSAAVRVLEQILKDRLSSLAAEFPGRTLETQFSLPRRLGHVSIRAGGLDASDTGRALQKIGEVVAQLPDSIGQADLDRARLLLRSERESASADQRKYLDAVLEGEMLELGATARSLFLSQLDALVVEDVRKAASKYLAAPKLVLAAAGDEAFVKALN
ncbi:MAG: M16 family metallopeptidase [Acidobacteriota bacterium]